MMVTEEAIHDAADELYSHLDSIIGSKSDYKVISTSVVGDDVFFKVVFSSNAVPNSQIENRKFSVKTTKLLNRLDGYNLMLLLKSHTSDMDVDFDTYVNETVYPEHLHPLDEDHPFREELMTLVKTHTGPALSQEMAAYTMRDIAEDIIMELEEPERSASSSFEEL